jgi:thioredoxin-like negative regulator of GroEL
MNRRIFLLSCLGLSALPVQAFQARPKVLIFPTAMGRLAAVTEEKAGPDGLTDGDRISMAARAVRERLDDEKVVTTLLYDGSDSYFQKAIADAKVKLAPGTEPDEAARIKIGAQLGVHYVVTVYSRLSIEQPLSQKPAPKPEELKGRRKQIADSLGQKPIEQVNQLNTIAGSQQPPVLEMEAIELRPGGKVGQRWQDRIGMAAVQGGRRAPGAIPPGMESAARTLVYRFLGGPLKEFTRTALDPSLIPPSTPRPAPAEVVPLDYDLEATRLITEAQEQLRRDQAPGAIALLRQAVNYQPRAAASRILLAEAYQKAHRPADAANEIRRALKLTTDATPGQRAELIRLLARALVEDGDQDGATQLFNQLLADNPRNSEARLGLAELLLARNQGEAAEIQFRLIREHDKNNVDAGQGLASLLLSRGALDEAIKEAQASPPAVRHAMATQIFIESAQSVAARMLQNRAAWEENKLSREIFYKAATSQSDRAKQLAELLTTAPPPENAPEVLRVSHNRRVLAANLLSQSLGSLKEFLETGEAATGVRARTLLNEFYTEMKDAQSAKK